MSLKFYFVVAGLLNYPIVAGEFPKKIIIHKDINKTIIAEDPAGEKTVEDVLIQTLAEEYKDHWNKDLREQISYADYVKNHLLPGNKTDKELKKQRNQKIAQFINFLKSTNHKYYKKVDEKFVKLSKKLAQEKVMKIVNENGKSQKVSKSSFIFDSCYQEINYLREQKIPFSFVLRTFGNDLDRVIKEFHDQISPNFFSWKGEFKNGVLELKPIGSDSDECTTLSLKTTAEMYEFLKTHGNVALHDDWKTWNSHGECQEYGKLFPIDLQDKDTVSVFFDDNAHPKDGILNPRHAKTNEILNVEDLIKSNHICVVNMLQAIEDDEYFTKHLQKLFNKSC